MNDPRRFVETSRPPYHRKRDYHHIDKEDYLFVEANYHRDLLVANYYRDSLVEANYYRGSLVVNF
jgi:hypothetical protein